MTALTIKQRRPVAGFTLIELVITIAILSIALLAVAQSLQFSAQFGADSLWQTKTVELVQAYSDEILTKKYDHNSPAGGIPACGTASVACSSVADFGAQQDYATEIRALFNDVDDYHNLNDSPPLDSLGAVRNDYSGYRVEVTVSYAGTDIGLVDNNNAKLISIIVTPPGQPAVPFSVYRGNF